MHPIDNILKSPIPFLDQLSQQLAVDGIDVHLYELDHICYRVASMERYEALKTRLAQISTLLKETQIGGRPIATYKLHQAILYKNRQIWCIELPAPKADSYYQEAYEHVEFVIQEDFESFMAKYPTIKFDTKGVSKPINADLRIKYKDFSVKFHHYSLEYVIKYLD